MRPLPNITGTVANYTLNGTLVDSSGNSPTLQSVDPGFETPLAPTWVTFDGCTQAAQCVWDGIVMNSKLMANAPLLRFTGAFTIQWTMVQLRTYSSSYFCVCDPSLGESPGERQGPDQIGSLWNVWTDSGNCTISDQQIGSNLPFPFAGIFTGANNSTWAQVPGFPPPYAAPAAFALTRDGGGTYRVYRNGVQVGASVPSYGAHISNGTEWFYIGGISSGIPPNGRAGYSGGAQFANVRALNYARSAIDIAADAAAVMSPCAAALQYRGVRIRIGGAS